MAAVKLAEIAQKSTTFRTTFAVSGENKMTSQFGVRKITPLFDRDMAVAVKVMEEKLNSVDGIIEVLDARMPLSSRNKLFYEKSYATKPHVLVWNKVDLVDKAKLPLYESELRLRGIDNILYTVCRTIHAQGDFDLLMQFLRKDCKTGSERRIMFVGLPNCGKSSMINALLRRSKVSFGSVPVGAKPGVTRRVSRSQINDKSSPIYLFDTPGVMPLGEVSLEDTMKMGLCDLAVEEQIGKRVLTDYLLYWLNKHRAFDYLQVLGLKEPTDNIDEVLNHLANQENLLSTQNVANSSASGAFDLDRAAALFLRHFRSLNFGKLILDNEPASC